MKLNIYLYVEPILTRLLMNVTFELCHIHILIIRYNSYGNFHLNTPIIQQNNKNNKSQLLSIIITEHATFQRVEKLI